MRRAFTKLGSRWRERGAGVILVSLDRWTLAEELWSYGEDETYPLALEISDQDMVRLWHLAGRIYWRGDARSAGEAAALAAVAVLEGEERPLSRRRRRPQRSRPEFQKNPEERLADVHRIEASENFPTAWR